MQWNSFAMQFLMLTFAKCCQATQGTAVAPRLREGDLGLLVKWQLVAAKQVP